MNLRDNLLIIGEGGFGSKIVQKLIKNGINYDCSVILASDSERRYIENIENDIESLIQLDVDGTGKKPKIAYKRAKAKAKEIDNLVKDYTFILHLVGFGGGTGAGTATYIAEKYQRKYHIFSGPMPSFTAGQDIIENSLTNISNLTQMGRIWPFDNRKNKDKLFFDKINKEIAKEIGFIDNLLDFNWVARDMDTGNIVDILFPEDYKRSGIMSMKRYVIENMSENISFNKFEEINQSVSFDFSLNSFGTVGVIYKMADNENYEDSIEYIQKFDDWLTKKIPGGSFHSGVYNSNDDKSEIILLLSGPVLSEEQLKDYIEENSRLVNQFRKNFEEQEEEAFSFKSENKLSFGSNNATNNDKKKEEHSFFDDDEESVLDELF